MDTEKAEFESWSEIYREHGTELEFSEWGVCIGTTNAFDPLARLEELLGHPVDRVAVKARMEEKDRRKLDGLGLLPGVLDRLDEADALGIRVGLASSASDRWVLGHLRAQGIEGRFAAIRTRTAVPRTKPFPDLFLAVAGALGVPPASCIVLEDSVNGIMAARAAGMFCVAVPNEITRRLDLTGADMMVPSLATLSLADIARRLETVPRAA
jgi:beta-phosphoglucomutase-like phosphatase (HAD superfamily)